MKRLLFALLLVPIICLGQSAGDIRNSYWNGSIYSTGTWSGSNGVLMKTDTVPNVFTPISTRVLFGGTGGILSSDADITFDATTNALGVGNGTTSSNGILVIGGTTSGTGTILSGTTISLQTGPTVRLSISSSISSPATVPVDLSGPVATGSGTMGIQNIGRIAPSYGISSPLNISGLRVWYSASSYTSGTNGQVITQLDDLSGNANHATQATASKRATLIKNGINGMSTLRFGGTSLYATGTTVFTSTMNTNISIYIATGNRTAPSQTRYSLAWNGSSGAFGSTAERFIVNFPAIGNFQPAEILFNPSAVMVTSARFNGTTSRVSRNGAQAYWIEQSGTMATTGKALTIGDDGTDSLSRWDGDISEVLIYDHYLSDQEHQLVTDYLMRRYVKNSQDYRIFFEGDSLTTALTGVSPYPFKVGTALTAAGYNFDAWSIARGGDRAADALVEPQKQIDQHFDGRTRNNIEVVWLGSNDLASGIGSNFVVNDTFNSLANYCQARRVAGFKVIIMTILPRTTSGFNTLRNQLNPLITANYTSFADGLADVAANTTIGEDGDAADTTYYSDGTHLTGTANQIVADIVAPAIRALRVNPVVVSGTVVLVSGTQSTVNSAITTNSTVIPTLRVVGGTVAGSPVVQVFAGTALFTGAATDTSTYNFMVINP